MILPAPVSGWLRVVILAVGCIVLSFAPVRGEEPLDCRKAEGYLIQNYREQYVPKDFPCPSRWWEYADVAVLALLLGTGTWLLLSRRPSRWVTVHLTCALLYFGIFRGGCICPVGATANVSLALVHPELIGRVTLALFLLPLVAALLCGRIFCGAVCPLGAVQQITAARSAKPLPDRLHRRLLGIPVLVLALTALMSVWKLGFLPCLLDPYKPFFFAGHALVQKAIALAGTGFSEPGIVLAGSLAAWAVFAGVVFLGRWIPRPFCRYICPFGVLLGLVSRVAFYRRRIDPDACAACARCETTCPVQAISVDRTRKPALLALSSYQCVQCGRCSDGCKFQASTVAPG